MPVDSKKKDGHSGENSFVSPAQELKDTLSLANPDSDFNLGFIGQYKLLDLIGRGGTGIVYRAQDVNGAEVAIKIMMATPLIPKNEIRRFVQEAETSKYLRKHPNIITVYDTGQDKENYYIVMEYVPNGRTLNDFVGKNLSAAEVLNYTIPIAKALAYAHSEGILHRDLKPGNILINQFNQPLLADFGLAKFENAPKLTITGTIMGTPVYMAPEQCGFGDGQVTKQSDIYSFGVMLYELLTGKLPYPLAPEADLPEVFNAISSCEPLSPRKSRKDISRNLEAVIIRMIEKEKFLRYKDFSQISIDMEACLAGKNVSVRKLTWAEKWEKWARRHAAMTITFFVVVIIGVLLYYVFILPKGKNEIYAKQGADINALSAKRKVSLLEKEIETLKNPGGKTGESDSFGEGLLIQARDSLSVGDFDQAGTRFESAMQWAQKNGHKGILFESASGLARLSLAKGGAGRAAALFENNAALCAKNTLLWRLNMFESGAAHYMDNNKTRALKIWQEIIDAELQDKTQKTVDNNTLNSYILSLSKVMTGIENAENFESKISSIPQILRGLGYWAVSQNTLDKNKKNNLIDKALKEKGIFIWIDKKEDENER